MQFNYRYVGVLLVTSLKPAYFSDIFTEIVAYDAKQICFNSI